MASVHRRVTPTGSVIYRAIWTEPGPGGTRRKRSKNFERAGEAKAFASRMEQEVEKRGVGDPQKHTLEGFLKRWIATLADRGEHSPTPPSPPIVGKVALPAVTLAASRRKNFRQPTSTGFTPSCSNGAALHAKRIPTAAGTRGHFSRGPCCMCTAS